MPPARHFTCRDRPAVWLRPGNRSVHHAAHWLRLLDCVEVREGAGAGPHDIVLAGGGAAAPPGGSLIRLWDFQVGQAGSGYLASAVSGAAAVIGEADGPPLTLPGEFPEKWCGAYGAILALAEIWRRRNGGAGVGAVYDVSAAEVLRCFALQNAGDAQEMAKSWRRNGRLAVEHGGIFPQGFYACRDGYVALLGRSRRDWRNILKALGEPDWAKGPAFADPFALAKHSADADALLQRTLSGFDRDELLRRGLANEAVIAPVYSLAEAASRRVFRPRFLAADGPRLPMLVEPLGEAPATPTPGPAAARSTARERPLAGLRCLELAWVWSGPLVGQILADLGAEVIKIEWPARFDLYRTRGVEGLRDILPEAVRREASLYFHGLNRNKQGITLDLKHPRGNELFRRLAARSTLVIENFTAGTLERLGLGPARLAAANPGLVLLSMSGPGRGSSVEALRSYGLVLSALGGAEALVHQQGRFLGSPTFSLSDPNAALFAALAALAGAITAAACGRGLAIDLSQIEAAATLAGSASAAPSDCQILAASDGGYLAVELPAARTLGADEQTGTAEALAARVAALGGRAARVLELPETETAPVFADCVAHLPSSHPVTGEELLVAAAWRVDGRRPPLRKLAPLMGEGNDWVLRRVLGLDGEEVAAALASGAM
ncbi:MAG: hypothetical protein FJX68_07795 [Alphaproteobacteria bacterium]|nr:hypothetical protein [Alphaproteobacteria bacterium]